MNCVLVILRKAFAAAARKLSGRSLGLRCHLLGSEPNSKIADREVPPPRISAKAAPSKTQLFQRDLAHGLVTHDLADFQALNCELALLLFSANQFGADRIGLVAQTI